MTTARQNFWKPKTSREAGSGPSLPMPPDGSGGGSPSEAAVKASVMQAVHTKFPSAQIQRIRIEGNYAYALCMVRVRYEPNNGCPGGGVSVYEQQTGRLVQQCFNSSSKPKDLTMELNFHINQDGSVTDMSRSDWANARPEPRVPEA